VKRGFFIRISEPKEVETHNTKIIVNPQWPVVTRASQFALASKHSTLVKQIPLLSESFEYRGPRAWTRESYLQQAPRPLPDHQMGRPSMRCNLQGEAIKTRREHNESNRTCHDLIYDTTSEAKSKDKHILTTKQRTHGEQSDLTNGSSSHSLTPIPYSLCLCFYCLPFSLVFVFMQALGGSILVSSSIIAFVLCY
jgi:hypothetical protein